MKYQGIKCEKCGREFIENDDVVVCPICGSPHHRACWLEDNACVHASEHETGYQWEMPALTETEEKAEPKAPLPGEFMLKNGESVVPCPRCGSLNCSNDVYCMRCGAPLKENADNFSQTQENEENYQYQREQMYADFNRFGGLDPNSELDGIPVAEYSDFVGGKTPGRIIRKISVMDRFGKNFAWCWPALFIGPVWFFWRKMKKEGLLLSALLLVISIAAGFLQVNAPLEKYYKDTFESFQQVIAGEISPEEFRQQVADYSNIYSYAELTPAENTKNTFALIFDYLAEPGMSILCAVTAMYFYRKKVKASVLDIRQRCTSMEEYRAVLQAEGGTSVGWAVVGGVLFLAAAFCMTYLPMLIVLL